MSLQKLMSGRKRDSDAWKYFLYNDAIRKSVCSVTADGSGTGKPCGFQVAGKNPTNLKVRNKVPLNVINVTCNKIELVLLDLLLLTVTTLT
jgi:hypothetical protein